MGVAILIITVHLDLSRGVQVKAGARLRVTGRRLGTTCHTSVTVGPAACQVVSANESLVTCILNDVENILSVRPYPVLVNVAGR